MAADGLPAFESCCTTFGCLSLLFFSMDLFFSVFFEIFSPPVWLFSELLGIPLDRGGHLLLFFSPPCRGMLSRAFNQFTSQAPPPSLLGDFLLKSAPLVCKGPSVPSPAGV